MGSFIKKYKVIFIFIGIGLVGGYLYWYFIGCNSGTCPITAVWYNNAAYGGVIGYLVGDTIHGYRKKARDKKEKGDSHEQIQ